MKVDDLLKECARELGFPEDQILTALSETPNQDIGLLELTPQQESDIRFFIHDHYQKILKTN